MFDFFGFGKRKRSDSDIGGEQSSESDDGNEIEGNK